MCVSVCVWGGGGGWGGVGGARARAWVFFLNPADELVFAHFPFPL